MSHLPQIIRPTESALALGMVTNLELLRLKSLARWYARGLPPDLTWEDLLQESLTRILVGKRSVPEGIPIVAFIAGVMRSIRSERWQQIERRAPQGQRRALGRSKTSESQVQLMDAVPGPDQALVAQQEFAKIRQLFAHDAVSLDILDCLGQGLTADEIRRALSLSDTDYASARKRMRRALLREGLTCAPK
jgi:DNA-directed RNA polymerase specialized sigma24 family protein